MVFTQDLAVLLGAGLPIDRALTILMNVIERDRFKTVVGDVLKSVQGGTYLSDALVKHPKVFSTFYVNMVRAGETGGVLDHVLDRLGKFLEASQELKDYILSAMIYPAFLVFMGGISLIILLLYVIPKFSVVFSDLGAAIPFSTRILLGLSKGLRIWWWTAPVALTAIAAVYFRYSRTVAGRLRIDRTKLGLPLLGELIIRKETANFARTLGVLLKSGVPILQALELVRAIIRNTVISDAMKDIYQQVKEGDRLSVALENAGILPSLGVQMMIVGEESGRLDDMLIQVAGNYERAVKETIRRLIGLLEPTMILCMGFVVGFIVIAMLMGVFSMNDIPF